MRPHHLAGIIAGGVIAAMENAAEYWRVPRHAPGDEYAWLRIQPGHPAGVAKARRAARCRRNAR